MKQALTQICVACIIAGTASSATAADVEGAAIAAKCSCNACHALDRKIVGPGFREVAKRYAGDASAPAKLAAKIKSGGSGAWGATPMPPSNVPEADTKQLVAWILAQG